MEYIIEYGVQVAATLLITLIGVFGSWLLSVVTKQERLKNISVATASVIEMAQITVRELQQTVVDGLKSAHSDGKLTTEEISELGDMLLDKTLKKLAEPTYALLQAAAVDVEALIIGAGESWINTLKLDAK